MSTRQQQRRAAAALATLAVFITGVTLAVAGHHGRHDGRPIVTATSSKVTVFAWNEKSFPVMPAKNYRQDFAKVLPLGGKQTVFLHSEMSAPSEVRLFKAAAKKFDLETYGVRKNGDTAVSTRGLPRGRTDRIKFADKPAGPASPARTFTATAIKFKAGAVAFISVHLSNGCFTKNRHKSWYPARCRALNAQIRLMHRVVAKLVNADIAVVIGGDMNVHRQITWRKGQSSATRGSGMVQLAAISSKSARLNLTRARPVPLRLHTDHRINQSTLTIKGN